MITKSFLQVRMINEIKNRSSLHSMRTSFLKFAERTSGCEKECFLAMYKAVTIIFTNPVNLEKKVLEFPDLNDRCIETLKKYAHLESNLQTYLEIFEFNVNYVQKSRSLSA